MRRLVLVALLGLMWSLPRAVAADDGDVVSLTLPAAQIGQQVALRLEVVTPQGATVEVDPGAPEWG